MYILMLMDIHQSSHTFDVKSAPPSEQRLSLKTTFRIRFSELVLRHILIVRHHQSVYRADQICILFFRVDFLHQTVLQLI